MWQESMCTIVIKFDWPQQCVTNTKHTDRIRSRPSCSALEQPGTILPDSANEDLPYVYSDYLIWSHLESNSQIPWNMQLNFLENCYFLENSASSVLTSCCTSKCHRKVTNLYNSKETASLSINNSPSVYIVPKTDLITLFSNDTFQNLVSPEITSH